MHGRMRAAVATFCVLAGAGVLAASCSLDLDENLINGRPDAGFTEGGPRGDGGVDEGGVDTGIPSGPNATACTNDEPCKTNHGCLKGKCDLSRKACTYEVCRPSACNVAACDQGTRACGGQPATYKYQAAQFPLGAPLLCGRCAVAVHPWLFAVLTTGLVAFNMSNPANRTPPQVPITGLPFVPNQLVRNGTRVFATGGPTGGGPSRFSLAVIDPPADPFVTKIAATSVLVTSNRPAAEGFRLFGRSGDSALFVGGAAAQFPSAFLEAPVPDAPSITQTPLVFPMNTSPLATSGKRVLMGGVNAQVATFALVDNAGSATPAAGAVTTLGDAGQVSTSVNAAESPDGAIFWAAGVHQGAEAEATTRAVRGYFLVPNETSGITGTTGVDIEVFTVSPAVNAAVVGPVAMIDGNTALVVTQSRDTTMTSTIQFVRRDPLGVVKEADNTTPRRQVLPFPLGNFAAATGSNGVGYVLVNEPGPNGTAGPGTGFVFDPACGL